MDFFQSQDMARRNTLKLVVLFLLALVSLVAITNLLVMVTMGMMAEDPTIPLTERIEWEVFLWISVAVIAVVGFGSVYKMMSLSGGGARVAEMMQARLIVDGSGDPDQQKVLNVVEEMAIAAGTPVPPVYLMEEDAINAFAAGYSQSDAVIGVTRGAIHKLSRDELQGVIAHEFSHILNGDMRLNIRLIGILHGIMILGLMGYFLMRSAAFSRRSRNGGNIVFLGLGLVVIGFAGTFFGNMIKSAVSRQREYLADASAVQYTRNPDGIAGALKRIGADTKGSLLENPGASEISHALFGNGVKSSLGSMFATHPPLKKRIKRLQPNWDGSFDAVDTSRPPVEEPIEDKSARREKASVPLITTLGILAEGAMAQAGNPGTEHIQYAKELHARLPAMFLQAAHDPYAARALVYLLLISEESAVRAEQLSYLQAHADAGVYDEVRQLLEHESELELEHRLPLINIALSGMRQMSAQQYELFRKNLAAVLQKDPVRGLKQWLVHKIVVHQLDAVFRDHSVLHHQQRLKLSQTHAACTELFSWLAYAGAQEESDPEAAFAAGVKALFADEENTPALQLRPRESLSLQALDDAADRLARLKPMLKPRVLKACAACIAADGQASLVERELFRAIAEIMECPVPPLLTREEAEKESQP